MADTISRPSNASILVKGHFAARTKCRKEYGNHLLKIRSLPFNAKVPGSASTRNVKGNHERRWIGICANNCASDLLTIAN
jgi:hypothetical protein